MAKAPRSPLVHAAGLVVLAALSLFFGFLPGASRARESTAPATSTVVAGQPVGRAEAEQLLAERYVPIYYLRRQSGPCDSNGEAFAMTRVETVIGGNPAFRLHGPRAPDVHGPTAADLAGRPLAFSIDYPGDPRSPGCVYERDFQRFSGDAAPTVYVRITTEAPESGESAGEVPHGLALQYWSFHYFNDWNNTHEGDWEMVQVTWDVDTPEEALAKKPLGAGYAQHGGGERHRWGGDTLHREDGHPVVYVSAGSHASYFNPRTYLGLGEGGTGFGCDVAVGPHVRIVPTPVVMPHDRAQWTGEFAWLTYDGLWGDLLPGEFGGPSGPQDQLQWDHPITWAERLRTGSTIIPGDSIFGLNSVRAFCTVVSRAAELLRAFFEYPIMISSAAGLVALLILGVALAVVKDSFRDPHVGPGATAFLDHRRTLGQMVRASAIVFWRHPLLFFGISFVFIPVDAVLSVVTSFVFKVPPFEWILWLFDANRASKFTAALLFGGVASLVVYVFVISGAIAAVRMLDAGEHATVRKSYATAFRAAPDFMFARVKTFLVIGVLGLTVIGLPIAFWLVVRWAFVEQAVMLDGATHGSAPAMSRRAVRGRWWRAAGLELAFGTWGLIAGPLLGFALLLGTNLPPGAVNLVAGLVHALALPFTAIGLCLAYRHLQLSAREDEARRADSLRRSRGVGRLVRRLLHVPGATERALERWLGRRPGQRQAPRASPDPSRSPPL